MALAFDRRTAPMKTAASTARTRVTGQPEAGDGAPVSPSSAALDPTLRRLAGFTELEPNWDSHGSKVPDPEAIRTAQELLRSSFASWAVIVGEQRALPSWVSPLPNGGVQIDWNGPAAELDVDIHPQGRIGYLLQRGHGAQATYDEADDVSPADVLDLLDIVLRS